MRWLVHHEFGSTHRPFRFPSSFDSNFCPETIDYWLERWIDAYTFLSTVLRSNPDNTIAVSFEKLCVDANYRRNLFDRIGVCAAGNDLKVRDPIISLRAPAYLVERAKSIYAEITELVSV
jgi:hypothetical protein